MTSNKTKSLLALAGFSAAVAGAAWFGSRYSPKDPRTRLWYSRLDKPSYNPPNYIFPFVWSIEVSDDRSAFASVLLSSLAGAFAITRQVA